MPENDKLAAAILTAAYLKAFQEMAAADFKTEVLKEDNLLSKAIELYVKKIFKNFHTQTT